MLAFGHHPHIFEGSNNQYDVRRAGGTGRNNVVSLPFTDEHTYYVLSTGVAILSFTNTVLINLYFSESGPPLTRFSNGMP